MIRVAAVSTDSSDGIKPIQVSRIMERMLLTLGAVFTLFLLLYVTLMQMSRPPQYPLLGHSSSVPGDEWFEQEVTQSELPVLVEFTTTWCGYCKQLAPVLADLAKAYGGRLKVVEVDGEKHAKVAQAFQIQGYPTLLVVKDGKIVEFLPGLARYETIEKMVLPHLAQKRTEHSEEHPSAQPDAPVFDAMQTLLTQRAILKRNSNSARAMAFSK
jgi:thioredoxin 1